MSCHVSYYPSMAHQIPAQCEAIGYLSTLCHLMINHADSVPIAVPLWDENEGEHADMNMNDVDVDMVEHDVEIHV